MKCDSFDFFFSAIPECKNYSWCTGCTKTGDGLIRPAGRFANPWLIIKKAFCENQLPVRNSQ